MAEAARCTESDMLRHLIMGGGGEAERGKLGAVPTDAGRGVAVRARALAARASAAVNERDALEAAWERRSSAPPLEKVLWDLVVEDIRLCKYNKALQKVLDGERSGACTCDLAVALRSDQGCPVHDKAARRALEGKSKQHVSKHASNETREQLLTRHLRFCDESHKALQKVLNGDESGAVRREMEAEHKQRVREHSALKKVQAKERNDRARAAREEVARKSGRVLLSSLICSCHPSRDSKCPIHGDHGELKKRERETDAILAADPDFRTAPDFREVERARDEDGEGFGADDDLVERDGLPASSEPSSPPRSP